MQANVVSLRLAVFASGQGSNLQNILDSIASGALRGVSVVLVVSNNSQCGAMQIAERLSIARVHISSRTVGESEEKLSSATIEALDRHKVGAIALAGYMKKLPDRVVERFAGRILNIHPALLPAFGGKDMYGMRVHEAVLARGCKVTGATVHFVTEAYDEGPILLQRCCPVIEGDTPQVLADRVAEVERVLYPEAVQLLADGRIRFVEHKTFIR